MKTKYLPHSFESVKGTRLAIGKNGELIDATVCGNPPIVSNEELTIEEELALWEQFGYIARKGERLATQRQEHGKEG